MIHELRVRLLHIWYNISMQNYQCDTKLVKYTTPSLDIIFYWHKTQVRKNNLILKFTI